MALSPWIPAGTVAQEPQAPFDPHGNGRSPFPTSQFELSSIPGTVKHLFGLTTFLTERDAWAGNVEELMTEPRPRQDCPMHFPDAPEPVSPWPPSVHKQSAAACGEIFSDRLLVVRSCLL